MEDCRPRSIPNWLQSILCHPDHKPLCRCSIPSTSSKCSASCCGSVMPTITMLPASSSSPPSPWGCPSTRRERLVVGPWEMLHKAHPVLGSGFLGAL